MIVKGNTRVSYKLNNFIKINVKETEKILKALANKRRLQILKYIDGKSSASVGDISSEIKLSFKSTSRHLAILRTSEIVEREQVNLTMIYSVIKPTNALVKTTLSLI